MFTKFHFLNISVLSVLAITVVRTATQSFGTSFLIGAACAGLLILLPVLLDRYIPSFDIAEIKSLQVNSIVWVFFAGAVAISLTTEYFKLFPRPSFSLFLNPGGLKQLLILAAPKLIGVFIVSFVFQIGKVTLKELVYRLFLLWAMLPVISDVFLFLNAACLLLLFFELDELGKAGKTTQQFLLIAFGGITLCLYGMLLPLYITFIFYLFRKSFLNIALSLILLLASAFLAYFLISKSGKFSVQLFTANYTLLWLLLTIIPAIYLGWIVTNIHETLLASALIWFVMQMVQSGISIGFASAASGAVLLLLFAMHEYETDTFLGRTYPHKEINE